MISINVTPGLISGLRNALLEALTDDLFAESEDTERTARALFDRLTETLRNPKALGNSRLPLDLELDAQIEADPLRNDGLILVASIELIQVLSRAISHVQASVLEFEVPIRIKLEPSELVDLERRLRRLTG